MAVKIQVMINVMTGVVNANLHRLGHAHAGVNVKRRC